MPLLRPVLDDAETGRIRLGCGQGMLMCIAMQSCWLFATFRIARGKYRISFSQNGPPSVLLRPRSGRSHGVTMLQSFGSASSSCRFSQSACYGR